MDENTPTRVVRTSAAVLLLAGLLVLGYIVMQDFLVPVLWAIILAYVTWPLKVRLERWLRLGRGSVAALMTVLLCLVIVLPVLFMLVSLRTEVQGAYDALKILLTTDEPVLPQWLINLPWLGPRLQGLVERLAENPQGVANWFAENAGGWLGGAVDILGVVTRNAIKFGIAVITVFFMYRDGAQLVDEVRGSLGRLLGAAIDLYWDAATGMTWAVVYGLVLTALAQGLLAGVGYAAVGMEAPVLLGSITAVFALVPFGAPVIWGSISIWLLWNGHLWAGGGLVLWGVLAVSSIDNLIRPLVISSSARLPFVIVLFGVLGGLSAFGLVGLFIGPVVLSVLLSVWRQWLDSALPPKVRDVE